MQESSDRSSATPLSPLSALEQQMGITSLDRNGSPAGGFGGEIDPDPDETPTREPVQYDTRDALFADTPESSAAAADEGEEAPGGLGQVDLGGMMAALGASALADGGDSRALLTQLEAMADAFEQQSGEPETEIRGKIALLQSVLDARPAAIAQSRARMDAVLRATDSQTAADDAAAAYREESALQSVCASSLQSIESEMDTVSSMLEGDPETAAVVAQLMSAKPN